MRFVNVVALTTMLLVTAARGTVVIPPTLDLLTAKADCVVHGTVSAVRSEWRGEGDTRRIVTVVTFAVADVIAGSAGPELQLEFLGGEIDGERLAVDGQPRFTPGDEEVLFVADIGHTICPVVAMSYGRYLVIRDPDGQPVVARDSGVPLTSLAEIAQPLAAGSPAETLRLLQEGRTVSLSAFEAAVRESAQRQGQRSLTER